MSSQGGRNLIKWDEEQQKAFKSLGSNLVEPPVIALPTVDDPVILDRMRRI